MGRILLVSLLLLSTSGWAEEKRFAVLVTSAKLWEVGKATATFGNGSTLGMFPSMLLKSASNAHYLLPDEKQTDRFLRLPAGKDNVPPVEVVTDKFFSKLAEVGFKPGNSAWLPASIPLLALAPGAPQQIRLTPADGNSGALANYPLLETMLIDVGSREAINATWEQLSNKNDLRPESERVWLRHFVRIPLFVSLAQQEGADSQNIDGGLYLIRSRDNAHPGGYLWSAHWEGEQKIVDLLYLPKFRLASDGKGYEVSLPAQAFHDQVLARVLGLQQEVECADATRSLCSFDEKAKAYVVNFSIGDEQSTSASQRYPVTVGGVPGHVEFGTTVALNHDAFLQDAKLRIVGVPPKK